MVNYVLPRTIVVNVHQLRIKSKQSLRCRKIKILNELKGILSRWLTSVTEYLDRTSLSKRGMR